MEIYKLILLSISFIVIFITFHLLLVHLISLRKTSHVLIPYVLSNFICFYFAKDFHLNEIFFNFFVINFSILIIYIEFLLLIKKGFTLSLISSFKKTKLSYQEITKIYSGKKGSKWLFLDRLATLKKFKIISVSKSIKLSYFGNLLAFFFIFLRTILSIKDFG